MNDRGTLNLISNRTLLLAVTAITLLAGGVPTAPAQPSAGQQVGLRQGGGTTLAREYRIQRITLTGFKNVPEDVLRKSLGVAVGEVYSDDNLRKGLEGLKQVYGNSGYINFVPTPTFDFDEDRRLVNLAIQIEEGLQFTVNRIRFTGNTTTPDDLVRREILVKEGSVFDASLWSRSLSQLNQLGLFEAIRTEDAWIRPSGAEPKVDIDLRLKDKAK